MIKQILKDLVESYQESEFINYSRDIGFFAARRELLCNGLIFFYESETDYPKNVTDKDCISIPTNPLVGDSEGRFSEVDGEGVYRIKIESQNGNPLLITAVQGG